MKNVGCKTDFYYWVHNKCKLKDYKIIYSILYFAQVVSRWFQSVNVRHVWFQSKKTCKHLYLNVFSVILFACNLNETIKGYCIFNPWKIILEIEQTFTLWTKYRFIGNRIGSNRIGSGLKFRLPFVYVLIKQNKNYANVHYI